MISVCGGVCSQVICVWSSQFDGVCFHLIVLSGLSLGSLLLSLLLCGVRTVQTAVGGQGGSCWP